MTGMSSWFRFRPSSRRRCFGASPHAPRRTAWSDPLSVLFLSLSMLVIASGAWAASAAGPTSSAALGHPEYTLGSGDVVKVTVFGQDDLSGEFTVDGQGMVSLPLIGNVKIGGLTVRQAEKKVVGELKPDYLKNPRVSIEVLNYRPFYIIGEVKKPGQLSLCQRDDGHQRGRARRRLYVPRARKRSADHPGHRPAAPQAACEPRYGCPARRCDRGSGALFLRPALSPRAAHREASS